MDANGKMFGYDEMLKKAEDQIEIPELYKEKLFNDHEVADFKQGHIWQEIEKRLIARLDNLFYTWMQEEDAVRQNKLRGQAIEVVTLLFMPNSMAIPTPDKLKKE